MSEAEWLVSRDVREMLGWLRQGCANDKLLCSDRKLHLFEDACFAQFGLNLEDIAVQDSPPPLATFFLRDIAGNPFRTYAWSAIHDPRPSGHELQFLDSHWLIPQVLSLAHAAYDERERPCSTCKGSGELFYFGSGICGDCHGTGRITDGTLDPIRLAILADALEEAGCQEEAILTHLRATCLVWGRVANCRTCHGTGNALHVRGCWAVDLLLGKEYISWPSS